MSDRELMLVIGIAAADWQSSEEEKGSESMNGDYRPKDKRLLPQEGEEQARLFNWAQMRAGMYPELRLMFHIPNGGKRGKAEAGRFKAEGVKAGVPDIFLPVSRGGCHGMFIELKRREGGKASKEQKEWLTELSAQGYRVVIAHGWEEAAEYIRDYLEGAE